jgi:hypothetical protein
MDRQPQPTKRCCSNCRVSGHIKRYCPNPPKVKKVRYCGFCHEPGHNRTKCLKFADHSITKNAKQLVDNLHPATLRGRAQGLVYLLSIKWDLPIEVQKLIESHCHRNENRDSLRIIKGIYTCPFPPGDGRLPTYWRRGVGTLLKDPFTNENLEIQRKRFVRYFRPKIIVEGDLHHQILSKWMHSHHRHLRGSAERGNLDEWIRMYGPLYDSVLNQLCGCTAHAHTHYGYDCMHSHRPKRSYYDRL